MDSGGGDPLANEFLEIARAISKAIPATENDEFGITQQAFAAQIDKILISLEGKSPLLVFDPDVSTITCFGAPKLGCVIDGLIHIAKTGWQQATENEKFQVTAMEVLLQMGTSMRYERAATLAEQLTPSVVFGSSVNLKTDCKDKSCNGAIQTMMDAPPKEAAKLVKDYFELDQALAVEVGFSDKVCLRVRATEKRDSRGIDTSSQSRIVSALMDARFERDLPMIRYRILRIIQIDMAKGFKLVTRLILEGRSIRARFEPKQGKMTIEILSGEESC